MKTKPYKYPKWAEYALMLRAAIFPAEIPPRYFHVWRDDIHYQEMKKLSIPTGIGKITSRGELMNVPMGSSVEFVESIDHNNVQIGSFAASRMSGKTRELSSEARESAIAFKNLSYALYNERMFGIYRNARKQQLPRKLKKKLYGTRSRRRVPSWRKVADSICSTSNGNLVLAPYEHTKYFGSSLKEFKDSRLGEPYDPNEKK